MRLQSATRVDFDIWFHTEMPAHSVNQNHWYRLWFKARFVSEATYLPDCSIHRKSWTTEMEIVENLQPKCDDWKILHCLISEHFIKTSHYLIELLFSGAGNSVDKQFKKILFLYHPDRAKSHEDQGTGLTAGKILSSQFISHQSISFKCTSEWHSFNFSYKFKEDVFFSSVCHGAWHGLVGAL